MDKTGLIIDLHDILMDAADKFENEDLSRILDMAARDLSTVAPLVKRASLTLVADQSVYAAPADMRRLLHSVWGVPETRRRKPWDDNWPGRLPDLAYIGGQIVLTPCPSAGQIASLGSTCEYDYSANYLLGDAASTNVPEHLKNALLYRATAQAMLELANRGVAKPVALGGSGNGISMPKNGHPAALAQDLLERYREAAA